MHVPMRVFRQRLEMIAQQIIDAILVPLVWGVQWKGCNFCVHLLHLPLPQVAKKVLWESASEREGKKRLWSEGQLENGEKAPASISCPISINLNMAHSTHKENMLTVNNRREGPQHEPEHATTNTAQMRHPKSEHGPSNLPQNKSTSDTVHRMVVPTTKT